MVDVAFDAVVLAGGKGSRLGGVDKASLRVGGVPLLDRVLDAVREARTTVVVGPVEARAGVVVTLEDPPGTGPAAGLVAGLRAVVDPAGWTLVLACDLPGCAEVVPVLLASLGDGDAYCARRFDGGSEWLLGAYRTAALRAAADAYGDAANRSVRGLLAPLQPVEVALERPEAVQDVDTWSDHAEWNSRLRRRGRGHRRGPKEGQEDRSRWRPFIEAASAVVAVDAALVDEDAVLDMTREVAHAGARPMAPVAALIMGLAVGGGADVEYARRVVEDAATAAPVPDSPQVRSDQRKGD